MTNSRPHLVISEEKLSSPILIIDKKGIVGSALANKLKEQFLVVLVSGKELEFHNNIVHVPYRKKVPVIPDNSYSHIFVFYNEEQEILDMLPIFIKKANVTNGKVFFLTSLVQSSTALFRRLSHHSYHSMKIILYGEVFDELVSLPNMVNLFIYQARKFGRLLIPNEGLGKLYPVYLEDLLVVIIAASFSQEKKGGMLFAFPRHPFTEISIARMFQKINPDLKIDFSKRKIRNFNFYIPQYGEHAFNNYNPEEGLKKINLSEQVVNREIILPKQRIKFNNRLLPLTIVAVLLVPLLLVFAMAGLGAGLVSASVGQAESGNFQSASNSATAGSIFLQGGEALGGVYLPAEILAGSNWESFLGNLRTGRQAADIETNLLGALTVFSNVYAGNSPDPKNDFVNAKDTVKNSLLKLEELKAQSELPQVLQKKLDDNSYMISLLENTIDSFPQLMGFNGRKKYLLLFQNNMELRPGGGFIGSYGTVTVEAGRVGKLEIHDVYDADGQLKTHIEPPYGLRRYEGAAHWFLRDSNFDVDFVNDAAAASDILKRETGDQIDGVIAIDTNFIKNLLSAIGPVSVDDYKEVVTSDNFYLLTEKHAENNFFPGSTQKKDFLRSLLNSILVKLSNKKGISYLAISKQVEKSLKEKHMLFASSDPTVEKVFAVNNLSASLLDDRVVQSNSITDFFGSVDANIGANKSNYYLQRSIGQSVSISDTGQVQESAAITYKNTSKKGSAFGGDYKNYIRFILPNGANLTSVSIDGQELTLTPAITDPSIFTAANFVPPSSLEIESTEESGEQVVGFFFIVPVQTEKTITVTYTIPQTVDTGNPSFSYSLRILKQPGTDMDPYSLTLIYPSKFRPVGTGKDIVDLGGKLMYETKLSEDKNININFSHK